MKPKIFRGGVSWIELRTYLKPVKVHCGIKHSLGRAIYPTAKAKISVVASRASVPGYALCKIMEGHARVQVSGYDV